MALPKILHHKNASSQTLLALSCKLEKQSSALTPGLILLQNYIYNKRMAHTKYSPFDVDPPNKTSAPLSNWPAQQRGSGRSGPNCQSSNSDPKICEPTNLDMTNYLLLKTFNLNFGSWLCLP